MSKLLKLPNGVIIYADQLAAFAEGKTVNGFWLENGRPFYGLVKHG